MVNDKIDKDKIVKKKCNSHSPNANWRIVKDKTIKYVDKKTKMPIPLVCSYEKNYFNTDFHRKLIVNCDNLSDEDCRKSTNFCSINNDKCQFDPKNLPKTKAEIYNSNIVNPTKDEMKRITDNIYLNNIDPKKIMTGRGDNIEISIVEPDCKHQKDSIPNKNDEGDVDWEKITNIDEVDEEIKEKILNYKYSCEKNITYPEVNLEQYNDEYNNPNKSINELDKFINMNLDSQNDSDKNDIDKNEGGKDIQGLIWDEPAYSSLLTDLQNNTILRTCIDDKLGIHKHEYYKIFMDKAKKTNFVIGDDDLKFIKHAVNKFISLRPEDIMECIEKLSNSDVVINKICKGDITLTMFETLGFVFEFIGIHIDFNDQSEKMVQELSEHIKPVLHKLITTSEYFEQISCNGQTSKITKNLKILYNSLFPRKSTSYAFLDYISKMFNGDWFKMFNNNIFGKVILLIFIAFIFSRMVDLFSDRGEALQK